jgi:hypothetical protein
MADVTIRSREDGVVELAPKHAPADGADRLLVIGTVLLAAAGLFASGLMPAGVLALIAASCLAGEVVLAIRALVLVLARPAADVLELARRRPQRR